MRFSKSCGRAVARLKMALAPALLGTTANLAIALCQTLIKYAVVVVVVGSAVAAVDSYEFPHYRYVTIG